MFESQRGTGLSTALTTSSMSQFKSAEKLADYLKHFRADNIVKDAEFVRKRLVPDSRPWTVLGQVKLLLFLLEWAYQCRHVYELADTFWLRNSFTSYLCFQT